MLLLCWVYVNMTAHVNNSFIHSCVVLNIAEINNWQSLVAVLLVNVAD